MVLSDYGLVKSCYDFVRYFFDGLLDEKWLKELILGFIFFLILRYGVVNCGLLW